MQFHILSFEGPDPYARVGGLATRVEGLVETLAELDFESHLWFIGDPERIRRRFRDRTVVVKMARFDPDKRWLAAVESVALRNFTWSEVVRRVLLPRIELIAGDAR